MQAEFVHVGYGATLAVNRVLAIASPDSSPIRRMVKEASKEGRIINLTYGRKAKCVVVLDSGHIVLAAFHPSIILRRIRDSRLRGETVDTADEESSAAEPHEEEMGERISTA